ncbi:MAG: cytochrome c [Armatimonadetes bacterium]|nr:cytochrome c [Armatimonadota bacterium]
MRHSAVSGWHFLALSLSLGAVLLAGCAKNASPQPSGPSGPSAPMKSPSAPVQAADGKTIFASNCIRCHGANAQGGPGPSVKGKPVKEIVTTVTNGHGKMPSFKTRLTAAQIQSVADYVSTLK